MTDPDRGVPPRDTERTTIIHTDGERRGGSGVLIAVVVIVALIILGYLFLGGGLNRAADEVGVNVNVDTPAVQIPDVNINVPDIDVDLPEVDVDTKDEPAENKS